MLAGDGVVGVPIVDYETGEPITYEDYVSKPPEPVSQSVEDFGSYDDNYELTPAAEFLTSDDEWLTKVQDVWSHFVFLCYCIVTLVSRHCSATTAAVIGCAIC